MQLGNNIKMALASLRSARWRSTLTMLGIIIGVASVVVTISIGEGVRNQVEGQIRHLGSDLITVRAGKSVSRSNTGTITNVNLFGAPSGPTLSEQDYQTIRSTTGVGQAVPFSLVSAVAKTDDREFDSGFVIATTDGLPQILNQPIKYGNFFGPDDLNKQIVVIGKTVALDLFGENAPVGKSLVLHGERLVVAGVFDQFDSTPLSPNADYNSAIFVPYQTGKAIAGQTQIYQVLVKPNDPKQTNQVVHNLNSSLYQTHGQQNDFTVLKQNENLAVTDKILNLLTNLIAGIAAISLVVGGVGIMNIMLVSVTERTKEIGVRKSVGATNQQILDQFITEAAVLSLTGGIIGVISSLIIIYFIRIFTDVRPVVTYPIIGFALLAALAVGMFFGIVPAVKAARRDPIEALRYE